MSNQLTFELCVLPLVAVIQVGYANYDELGLAELANMLGAMRLHITDRILYG